MDQSSILHALTLFCYHDIGHNIAHGIFTTMHIPTHFENLRNF